MAGVGIFPPPPRPTPTPGGPNPRETFLLILVLFLNFPFYFSSFFSLFFLKEKNRIWHPSSCRSLLACKSWRGPKRAVNDVN